MNDERSNDSELDEKIVFDLMKMSGQRSDIPEDIHWRLKTSFEASLKKQQAAEPVANNWKQWLVAVPAFAAMLLLVVFLREPASPTVELAPHSIVTSISGAVYVEDRLGRRRLQLGAPIYIGDRVIAESSGYLAFNSGKHRVRLNSDTSLLIGHHDLTLIQGTAYIDTGPLEWAARNEQVEGGYVAVGSTLQASQPRSSNSITIVTSHGRVTDIGTQFLVHAVEGESIAMVRDGTISIQTATETVEVSAEQEQAWRVELHADRLASTEVSRFGTHWQWLEAIPSSFELDGKYAATYLQWYHRLRVHQLLELAHALLSDKHYSHGFYTAGGRADAAAHAGKENRHNRECDRPCREVFGRIAGSGDN